jgi:hypothetical protein
LSLVPIETSQIEISSTSSGSFRTYHQVQQWYGNQQNAEQWGWKRNKNGLIPVTTLEPSAPESLLKLMQKEMSKSLWMQKGWVKVLRYMHDL